MARHTRIEVALKMKETGVVPVFYHKNPALCIDMVKVLYQNGVRVFEFTNRGDFAHEVFTALSKAAAEHYPDMALGIGSIVDAPTAALYIQLGADFIVSPILNPEVAKVCNRRKVGYSPGCGTLSEISYAEELGAEVVKIFPGSSVGGPEFVKSVKGPCPWTSIMPTGGVKPEQEDLERWFKAGVHCVGMGSQLFIKKADGSYDLEATGRKTAEVIDTIKGLR